MNEAVVIGSGHAGVATARELVRLGHQTVMIDVGRTLDDGRARLVERLRDLDPVDWDDATTQLIRQNETLDAALPRPRAFGSDYVYEQDEAHPLPSTRSHPQGPAASLARGGLSNVWGASVLPAHDCDMDRWPLTQAELAPHYRRVLGAIPLSGAQDGLEEHFPIFRDSIDHLTIPPTAQLVLDRLERTPAATGEDVAVGRSRLAVRGDPSSATGCRYCGHCHSSCAYGAIHTAASHLDELVSNGDIRYRQGLVARSIAEERGRAIVTCTHLDGTEERIVGDRVFVAAGAIGSTRIVLESLELWDHAVRLPSAHGFVIPIIVPTLTSKMPANMTLASFFVEFKVPPSPHWVHAQVSPPNELATAKLLRLARRYHLPQQITERISRQTLIALCQMHSNEGGHHVLSLEQRSNGEHRLHLDTVSQPSFPSSARRAARRLRQVFASAGVPALPPAGSMAGPRPMGWHFGGSLPMTAQPQAALDTDVLGRPQGYERTHVVDAAILPSIPATTIALVTMANATRIVNDALGGT